jgi:hypothetical protein
VSAAQIWVLAEARARKVPLRLFYDAEGVVPHLYHRATQFVVHEALEMTWCAAESYAPSLTPSTIVRRHPCRVPR